MRLAVVLGLLLSACASEPGWTNSGTSLFDNAKSRCQIETQTVDGPDWERCMAALGWGRTP